MYRGFHGKLGATAMTIAAFSLGGCAQATRHSNTMIFGTNTTVGFKVGQNVSQAPEIMLAYDRQEAVIMPLLANTGERLGGDGLLSPCTPAGDATRNAPAATGRNLQSGAITETLIAGADLGDGKLAGIHPCSFVGYRVQDGKVFVQDSYSVLASFGADFGGQVDAAEVGANAGLAQYFATGIAAQLLAVKGGAALVATGAAARKSAEAGSDAGIAALITGNPAFTAAQTGAVADAKLEDQIVAKIGATSPANLQNRLTAFEQTLGITTNAVTSCQPLTPAACADFVDKRDVYADHNLSGMADKVTAALAAWATP